jgi:hypothetical protein
MTEKKDVRTLKNNSLSWPPEVAKCPFLIFCFEKYWASIISEDPDLSRVPEILDRLIFKVAAVLAFHSGEAIVEARVLLESETLFALEAAEVPKNFFQLRLSTKHLCYTCEINRNRVRESTLTFHDAGACVGKRSR